MSGTELGDGWYWEYGYDDGWIIGQVVTDEDKKEAERLGIKIVRRLRFAGKWEDT